MRFSLVLALAALPLLAACSAADPAAFCRDPLVLDQMRRLLLFPNVTAGATVTLANPRLRGEDQGENEGGAVRCQAEVRLHGKAADLLGALTYGYPFTLPQARAAFAAGSGFNEESFTEARAFLRWRAGNATAAGAAPAQAIVAGHEVVNAGGAGAAPITLNGALHYRVTREPRPFLLAWQFADGSLPRAAGAALRAAYHAQREAYREEQATLAAARGYDSIAAMRAADAARRVALAQIDKARAAGETAQNRISLLQRHRERLRGQAAELAGAIAAAERLLQTGGSDWEAHLKRESFAVDTALLAFDDPKVVSTSSYFGFPEDRVVVDVASFASRTLGAVQLHVVVWHAGVQRFFEDAKIITGFGREGLAPGERMTLQFSLNGSPGVGLAFVGDAFKAPGERHVFLFVNRIRSYNGDTLYKANWTSPLKARREARAQLEDLHRRQAELKAQIAQTEAKIAAAQEALAAAKAQAAQARRALPQPPE